MEESKKRWRPTLTAYRNLENELGIAKQDLELARVAVNDKNEEIESLKSKVSALERSNQSLSDGIKILRDSNEGYENEVISMEKRISFLENRGFWDRLFNK